MDILFIDVERRLASGIVWSAWGAPLMTELEALLDAELNTAHVRFMQSPSSVREGREHWSG